MKYPSGVRRNANNHKQTNTSNILSNYSNRGMTLEEDINATNKFYLETDRAVIHKKPTPVQIVRVNYPKRSAAVITEAYFQAKSTTDYNGIYRGHHIDFEAKETKNKTIFPLANIHEHQFEHMNSIIQHKGICFLLVRFVELDRTFFLSGEFIVQSWQEMLKDGKKSIPLQTFETNGYEIPFHYQARINYLDIVDAVYF